jgi:hypothetical protein
MPILAAGTSCLWRTKSTATTKLTAAVKFSTKCERFNLACNDDAIDVWQRQASKKPMHISDAGKS